MSEITVRLTADETLLQLLQALLGQRDTPMVQPLPPTAALPAAPAPLPTAPAPSYKLDDLMRAGAALVDAGRMAEVQALMQSYGVQTIMQVPPEQYGELATAMRGMGAMI